MTENKNGYKDKIDARLREWAEGINLLKALVDRNSSNHSICCSQQIEDLRARCEGLLRKLKDLESAEDHEWEMLKTKVDGDMETFRDAISRTLILVVHGWPL